MGVQTLQRSWQDQDILRYLGREAPRYTSYPSAHHFSDLSPQTYGSWLETLTPDQSVGLYLHVPFCPQMCYFCGCNTQITKRYDPVASYVDCLIREINMAGQWIAFKPRVHSVHFGGGSPGILEPADMGRIFETLHARFEIAPDAEVSIELDPRRITAVKAQTYAALGFNRVSMGVQDTQTEVQVAINRVQPIEVIQRAADLLRSYGLNALGIDLVYGLPMQTRAGLEATLKDVKGLDADRISAFSYAHVPWFKKHQTLIRDEDIPGVEAKADYFLTLSHALEAQGYQSLGIDHFAKPDDGLCKAQAHRTLRRNFMGYTDMPNDRLIAFGASSISELDDGIAQNIPQSTAYQNTIGQGTLATKRGWAYHADDKLRKAVISDLMCYFEADVAAILARFGYPADYFDAELTALSPFIRDGLVSVRGGHVRFHSPLKMLARSVACIFDLYAQEGGTNRYSRVA
ncbi:oxygen-independent coproporphyrinogen III oxidase [Asticcacaulis sp. SL142]|uniref:oxygen-independent coproporphyrinogen III oxidase n=1 Tax=Asticcacaulis sp. SL142 TaxID=2995155 RepID=UPI00226CF4AF|nr:oxygen-independent coproporphyrinogen III oxidase [Asticcacaulis sp. SL142]WAC48378.1 oxygen-independent coproporphyrinogen III oxidase [Asticcacaulis sp. SL142]